MSSRSNQLKYTELNQVLRNENTMQQSEAETVLYFKNSNAVFTGNYRYQDENLDAFLKKKGISEEEFLKKNFRIWFPWKEIREHIRF